MISKNRSVQIIIALILMALRQTGYAQGDLLVTPTRVVFDSNDRNKELTLLNKGKDTAVYVVSWVQHRMNENGRFERIEEPDPGQHFADPFIRFFPKRFVLAPNQAQTLRMQLRRKSGMIDGEYRSHLYLRSEPDAVNRNGLAEKVETAPAGGFKVELIPVYGITLPIIVQNGKVNAAIEIDNLKLQAVNDSIAQVDFKFLRSGNISVNGKVTVDHIDEKGDRSSLAAINGVSVYAPNAHRNFSIPFLLPETLKNHGRLEIKYQSNSDQRDQEVYVKKEVQLQE